MIKEKRILVTGGAGYIGCHTVDLLIKRGWKVYVLDDLSEGHRESVPDNSLIVGDFADENLLRAIFREFKIEAVIHFAGKTLVEESTRKPDKYFYENTFKTMKLLKIMLEEERDKKGTSLIREPIKYFIFSSTAAVYGEPKEIPIKEEHPCIPTNAYGESKLMIEKILKHFEKAYGIKYISLRYFNAAGADPEGKLGELHKKETHLIPIVLRVAKEKKGEVSIFGTDYPTKDGTCVRDYIHVVDLAEAHILALEYLIQTGKSQIFNLGNGNGYSVKEVIDIARKITGYNIPAKPAPRRAGDPSKLVASSKKISEILGWKPRYPDLESIIQTAWNWHLKEKFKYAQ